MTVEIPTKRWLSSGYFRAAPTEGVDREAGVIKGVALNTVGEAKGHGVSLDEEFVQDVVRLGSFKRHGLKARFGHPNMCSTTLGTYIGRFKNIRMGESVRDGEMRPAAICALHLSETAKTSPSGDLHTYVLDMAENEPDMFGTSIVFTPGPKYYRRNEDGEKVYEDEDGFDEIGGEVFTEIRKLHACDAVDEPAANDGLFSSFSGETLAGQVTEFLDVHPEVWDAIRSDPSFLEALSLRGAQVDEFVARYSAYREGRNDSAGATGEDDIPEAPSMDFQNEQFVALCERLGIEIPEDADQEFADTVIEKALSQVGTLEGAVESLGAQKDETEAALTEANEKIAEFEAKANEDTDEEPDVSSLAESDDPRVQKLLAENAEMQQELDVQGRELSDNAVNEQKKLHAEALAEAEKAAEEGKLNEEGVEAFAALLSATETNRVSLGEDGEPVASEFDVAGTARKLIGSLKANAALDLGERTVRKNGNEDQTVVVTSNDKDQDELSDEKVTEHAERLARSIGQGKDTE